MAKNNVLRNVFLLGASKIFFLRRFIDKNAVKIICSLGEIRVLKKILLSGFF